MSSSSQFLACLRSSAAALRSLAPKEIILLHHNDADGLTTGAVLMKAFERETWPVRRYCLEKPYPAVLERLFGEFAGSGRVFVFGDFASGMLPEISAINKGRSRVFVLDHHRIEPVRDDAITLVNCLEFGITGNKDCSASALCFHFARALNPWNDDLAYLGALGALGDGHVDSSGKLSGWNLDAYEIARSQGGEIFRCPLPTEELVEYVNALGSFGYFSGGPDIGIKGLLEGFDGRYVATAREYVRRFRGEYDRFVADSAFNYTKHLLWFDLRGRFSGMGVKTVGLLCEKIKDDGLVDRDRYVLGFQPVPAEIPGLGRVMKDSVKVSMRTPIADYKSAGRPSVLDLLPPATRELGGFVDACHPHAGAVTVDAGRELDLVLKIESRFL